MMHRQWMRARLRAYHDGSLAGRARVELEAHLTHCEACGAELRTLEEMDALLSRCRVVAPVLDPADAQSLFQAAYSASGVGASPLRAGNWRWRLAGAAVLMMFGAAAYGLSGRLGSQGRAVSVAQTPPLETKTNAGERVEATTVGRVWSGTATVTTAAESVPTSLRRRRGSRRRSTEPAMLATATPQTEPNAETWEEAPALFVAVERQPVVLKVSLTEAPPEAPGFARVSSVRYDPTGQVVTQATVSSCAPEPGDEDMAIPEPEEQCGGSPATSKAPDKDDKHQPLPSEQREEREEKSDACD